MGPPPAVIDAFGATGEPVALAGGRTVAWRVDGLVFKPSDFLVDELAWQIDVLPTIKANDLRLSIPQRAAAGRLIVDGWSAWSYLSGVHRARRWLDVVAVGQRLHRAMAAVDRPDFIAERTDPWAVGDRVAWGESRIDPYLDVPHVARLVALRRPVDARSQLIHGDLTGNVLFADGLPPAVIDLSLYWRPAAFATAIIVADALVWEGADESLLGSVAGVEDFSQMLVRALLFRLVASAQGGFEDEPTMQERYRRAVDLAALSTG